MMNSAPGKVNFFLSSVVLLAALGGLLFGYETAVVAGALSFIHETFHTTTLTDEIIVSSLIFTAVIGAATSGYFADRWGRKKLLLSAAVFYIIGSLCIASAFSIKAIVVGRLIVGFAIGASSYVTPLFIAEMAPAKHRGRLLLINGIFITSGQVAALLVDYVCSFSGSWRVMFLLGTLPAIILLIGFIMVPETPRWCLLKGLNRHALKALIQLRGFNYRQIINEFREIRSCLPVDSAIIKVPFKIFYSLLLIGTVLGIFQQLFGINAFIYYGPGIFKMMGLQGTSQQILSTFFITIVNATVTIVMMLLIDRLGRRPLLIVGSGLAGLNLLAITLTINHPALAWLTFAELILYIMGYCMSVGSLFWVIISEIYPLAIRGIGMSVATAAQWAANLMVSCSFLTMLEWFGASKVFLFFSFICFCCMLFCYYCVPETKKVSLERIEKNLARPLQGLINDAHKAGI